MHASALTLFAPTRTLRVRCPYTCMTEQPENAIQSKGLCLEPGLARLFEQRRVLPRQQCAFCAPAKEPVDQTQYLPLAPTHFLAGVEVQDAHQLMILALEYFKNA